MRQAISYRLPMGFLFVLIFAAVSLCSLQTFGDEQPSPGLTPRQIQWLKDNPDSLPIWMTPEEEARKHEIGKDFKATAPPPAGVRQPAEFEPMSGVLIRYPLGIPYDLIAEMSEDADVWTIVSSSYYQSQAESNYASNGVNMANCYFFIAGTDSYWTRDYGPWYIFTGNDEQGIVDHIYNRPRPNDDEIPDEFGSYLGIPVYAMPLIATGGNYMCDGLGIAMSSRLTYDENPGMTQAQVQQTLSDYCGISQFYGLPYVESGGIHHIDCWAKFLTPGKILVEEETPVNPDLESNVTYLQTLTSSWGIPYEIVRIPVQGGEAYTNSLILNNKILVPIFGTSNDSVALQVYEDAMPGYEVIGFDGSWWYDDALHCRAMGITDRYMLYIDHIPLQDTDETVSDYLVEAEIFPYSGQALAAGSPTLWYSIDGGLFTDTVMSYQGSNLYYGYIPAQPSQTKISYYINAEDLSGRNENHPYIGAPMAHEFDITGPANSDPVLSNASVTPSYGYYGTRFEYLVDYYDDDGDAPSLIQVYIDDTGFDMELDSGTPSNGTYRYRTRDISQDEAHTCYFTAQDGYGGSARLPSEGTIPGPTTYDPELFCTGTPGPDAWMNVEVWGCANALWGVAWSKNGGPFYLPASGLTYDVGPANLHLVKKIMAEPLNLDEFGFGVKDFQLPGQISSGIKYIQGTTKLNAFWAKTNQGSFIVP